jgi:thioredoxin 1
MKFILFFFVAGACIANGYLINIRRIKLILTAPKSVIMDILSNEAFENVTLKSHSKHPIVIDFQKSQCKPCKRIAPAFEALSMKYRDKVEFYKIDADSSKEALVVMRANGIKTVPTFHIWRNQEKIDTIIGAHIDDLENILIDELKKIESRI